MRVNSQYQDYVNYASNPPPENPELKQGGSSGSIRYPDLHTFAMPAPSAPPLDDEEETQELDDCSICLEKCTDHPEGDASLAMGVAKTACKHVFHDICLQKWMATPNRTCPNCRGLIEAHKITHIKLPSAQDDTAEDADSDFGPQNGSLVVELAEAATSASLQALSFFGRGMLGLAKMSGRAALAVASGAVSALQVSEETKRQRAQEKFIRMRVEAETYSQSIRDRYEAQRNYTSRYFRERSAQMARMDSNGQNAALAEMAQFNRILAHQSAEIEATLNKLKGIAEKQG